MSAYLHVCAMYTLLPFYVYAYWPHASWLFPEAQKHGALIHQFATIMRVLGLRGSHLHRFMDHVNGLGW